MTTLVCSWPGCTIRVNPGRGGRFFERPNGSQYGACCTHAPLVVVGKTLLSEAAIYAVNRVQAEHPDLVEAFQDAAERYASFYAAMEGAPPEEPAPAPQAPGPDRDVVDVEFTEVK